MVSRQLLAGAVAGIMFAVAAMAAVAQTSETGPDLVEETFRDWIVRCETPPTLDGTQSTRICELTQDLNQADTGQRVLRMALRASEDGAAVTLVTPFGLRLADGVALDVATERVAEIAFRTCLPQGRIATTLLDDAAFASLFDGDTVTVILTTDAGQTLSLSVSLGGFPSAWARLVELR